MSVSGFGSESCDMRVPEPPHSTTSILGEGGGSGLSARAVSSRREVGVRLFGFSEISKEDDVTAQPF
jgi:hypothetical protein